MLRPMTITRPRRGGRSRRLSRPAHEKIYGSIWKLLDLCRREGFWWIFAFLVVVALVPPIFFHFRLQRLHQMRTRKCGWVEKPPLVCAHGGDTTNAFPNTMAAYLSAIQGNVDCIEIDVSRSADGVLLAIHDRDLHQITGNTSLKVGNMVAEEIKHLSSWYHRSILKYEEQAIPTAEEAIMFISTKVKQVIVDVKVGPPMFEKGLAKDILFVVEMTKCKNCLVWGKSDTLIQEIIKLSPQISTGYVVMIDPESGIITNPVRINGAKVAGVYHKLIDSNLVRILHRKNISVYTWTVDDEVSMRHAIYEGIDAVVTNKPATLQRLIHYTKTQCRAASTI